ncbi:hypothetical protein Cni_G10987 [Canna indica]|uniref:Methyltransferase-like protein 13 n=1 Tax=Canna indica TaxID=4628 RepID=A0AAQ3K574_9LILI|nr:hypothetical protein Cni_G10987 [Canna indica]
MEPGELERLFPSRFVSFAFPNPQPGDPYADLLRVAVLDSPLRASTSPPCIAAMLVPFGREDDWIFSTVAGHLQLLLSSSSSENFPISRLILVGDLPSSSSPKHYSRPRSDPDSDRLRRFQQRLMPLLFALSPKASFCRDLPDIPFLSFEDDVLRVTPVEKLVGAAAGEMLVEDVELDRSPSAPPELRRRLRFKRMPNLVQSQVRLVSDSSTFSSRGSLRPEAGSLVQPYLKPMLAGLSLIAPDLGRQVRSGLMPRALCIGVGGGALLMSLRLKFGFHVLGIEADDAVLNVAKRHFGFQEDDSLKVGLGEGLACIKFLSTSKTGKTFDPNHDKTDREPMALLRGYSSGFDAIMVDLDSEDAGNGFFAPPLEFVESSTLMAVRTILKEHGVLVVNVIPPSISFYEEMIESFHKIFAELYELDVGNGENYVLVATVSPIIIAESKSEDSFFKMLEEVVGETYANDALLAGKCNLAYSGFGALVVRSNPLTQTNPAKYFLDKGIFESE